MSNLIDAVIDLADHPKALARFKEDPKTAAGTFGLSAEKASILGSNNVSSLHKAIASEVGDTELGGEITLFICIVVS